MNYYTPDLYQEILKFYETENTQSMEMLFYAKMECSDVMKNCGLTEKEMKITFNEYCRLNPPTYVKSDTDQLTLF